MYKILRSLSLIILFSPVLQSQESLSNENDASACKQDLYSMEQWVQMLPTWKNAYPDPKELWRENYGMLPRYISINHKFFYSYAGYASGFQNREDNVQSNLQVMRDDDNFYMFCMKLSKEN